MKSVFSNQNAFEKLLTFLALAPFVRKFIPQAEASGETGPMKRAFVIASTVAQVAPFIASGWMPPDVADERTIGKFIDTFVRQDNAAGGVSKAADPELMGSQDLEIVPAAGAGARKKKAGKKRKAA